MGSYLLKRERKKKEIFQFSLPWLNLLTETCSHTPFSSKSFQLPSIPLKSHQKHVTTKPKWLQSRSFKKKHQYLQEQFSNGEQGGAVPPQEQQALEATKCWKGGQGRIFRKSLGGYTTACLLLGKYYIFISHNHNINIICSFNFQILDPNPLSQLTDKRNCLEQIYKFSSRWMNTEAPIKVSKAIRACCGPHKKCTGFTVPLICTVLTGC